MVFVRVRTDNIVKLLHTVFFEIGIEQVTALFLAAINQHCVTVTEDQRGVILTDIDKMHLKTAAAERFCKSN